MTSAITKVVSFLAMFCLPACLSAEVPQPVLHYSFDPPTEETVRDVAGKIDDEIEGNFKSMPGPVGAALKPDGYTTRIVRSAEKAPALKAGFSVEAWVAHAAYPWNWCPVLSQRDGEEKGYYFAVGPRGDVALELAVAGEWRRCVSQPDLVPLRQWTHVAATYDPGQGAVLYVNGKEAGRLEIAGAVDWADAAAMVSLMNREKRKPSHIHRPFGTLPGYFSIDGPVDEMKLYDEVLSAKQIAAAARPPNKLPGAALPLRQMPSGPAGSGRFGAYYTNLKYYEEWDALWAVDKDTDVIIRFDQSPTRMVFWRGTRYSPAWVSENGLWMADQSVEAWNKSEGCYEHMQDRRCRYSHVRVIESNDARAVVHWRYAPVCAHDKLWREDEKTTRACWVDEYYYIYPDQLGVRKPTWKTGTLGGPRQFQESLPFTTPGQTQGDVLPTVYAHLSNLKGERAELRYVVDPQPREVPQDLVIQQFDFRSKNKPSIIFEPGSRMRVRDRKLPEKGLDTPGTCSHWPVGQPACDGRTTHATDRPTHFMSFPISNPPIHEADGRSWWNGLYGMTELDMDALIFVAKSWSYPAELTLRSKGFRSHGYDRSERAYQLSTTTPGPNGDLALTLVATADSPVFNPAFVVKSWAPKSLKLKLDGLTIAPGGDFRVGVRHTLAGDDTIVWLKHQSTEPVTITLKVE